MKTFILLVLTVSLWSGVYDYRYSPEKGAPQEDVNNTFFTSDFERIVRYSPIVYTPSDPIKIDQSFRDNLESIHQSIQAYSTSGMQYRIVVVAHTRADADKELIAAQQSTFFGSLQDSIMESHAHIEESKAVCSRALGAAKKQLMDHNIDEKSIILECQTGKNPLFLENDGDARDNNYYINVTLYQLK